MKIGHRNGLSVLGGAAISSLLFLSNAAAQTDVEDGSEPISEPEEDSAPKQSKKTRRSDDKLKSARPVEALSRAQSAMEDIDYKGAEQFARAAIRGGTLSRAETTDAYRLLSYASAQLSKQEDAEAAFIRYYALNPSAPADSRLSPVTRTPMLSARGFWALQKKGFGVNARYDRRRRELVLELRDPILWAKKINVWTRTPRSNFSKSVYSVASLTEKGSELVVAVDSIDEFDDIEAYVFLEDEHGNVIAEVGRAREPRVFALTEEELDSYVRRDIRGGRTGSYGLRLQELGVTVGVHGYASLEFRPIDDVPSFDLHHATLMLRAGLGRHASLEIALEWEHLGRTESDFYLPHAFIDLKQSDALIFRVGFFETPVGAFNEYLYPDFLRVTGLPPLMSREVVPALWSEVGVQVRGSWEVGKTTSLTYAAFVSNGLKQTFEREGFGFTGGNLRSMRFNDRDRVSADKAVGGRIGLESDGFTLGASGYTGEYSEQGGHRLNIADVDISYRNRYLIARAEGATAWQEATRQIGGTLAPEDVTLVKSGAYALLALRPSPYLQPYLQYDYIDADSQLQRGLLGAAFYPVPHDRQTATLRLKAEVGYEIPSVGDPKFVWFTQLTTGF